MESVVGKVVIEEAVEFVIVAKVVGVELGEPLVAASEVADVVLELKAKAHNNTRIRCCFFMIVALNDDCEQRKKRTHYYLAQMSSKMFIKYFIDTIIRISKITQQI